MKEAINLRMFLKCKEAFNFRYKNEAKADNFSVDLGNEYECSKLLKFYDFTFLPSVQGFFEPEESAALDDQLPSSEEISLTANGHFDGIFSSTGASKAGLGNAI